VKFEIILLSVVLAASSQNGTTPGETIQFHNKQTETLDTTMAENTRIKVGDLAPDFTLPDQNGAQFSLKELRGRVVVLYFYPKDHTPGCTREACDFRDGHQQFQAAGAVVIGISPDKPASHTKFIQDYQLPFTLLADTTHQIMESYGAWGPKKMYGVERIGVIRSTVLIDKEGKVAALWPSVKVDGHAEVVLETIRKLNK
jgi:peroxiredoxin Q/BCP